MDAWMVRSPDGNGFVNSDGRATGADEPAAAVETERAVGGPPDITVRSVVELKPALCLAVSISNAVFVNVIRCTL